MEIFLMTRGTYVDYSFLGKLPSTSWWNEYSDWTSFEYPTIILVKTPNDPIRLILSGIPSQRKDKISTKIRYTLVIESEDEFKEKEIKCICGILFTFMNDISDSPEIIVDKSHIGEKLDDKFSRDYVDSFLAGKKNDEKDIQRKLSEILTDFDENDLSDKSVSSETSNAWRIGCWKDKEKINEWMVFTENILCEPGKAKIAAFLNLSDGKEDLKNIRAKIRDVNSGYILMNGNEPLSQGGDFKNKAIQMGVRTVRKARNFFISIKENEQTKEITRKIKSKHSLCISLFLLGCFIGAGVTQIISPKRSEVFFDIKIPLGLSRPFSQIPGFTFEIKSNLKSNPFLINDQVSTFIEEKWDSKKETLLLSGLDLGKIVPEESGPLLLVLKWGMKKGSRPSISVSSRISQIAVEPKTQQRLPPSDPSIIKSAIPIQDQPAPAPEHQILLPRDRKQDE